ncbi:hypothetical protein GCM10010869_44500 [Mesorhizobium tianshanense]|uniref:Uncharacterized protein n=1 Tax=Mesorhizobium tianshanense TaxID=39844 RepID=A0A562N7W9_9HYPH|nr:hypothetical protein [Mesorhizobium tianshanense]TWI28265.1 hypothetical protein IQ26_05305 [Mesorhizobium tianshanense]GLS38853.1 hypothetical protein GCM10010869_44500 [Mesorhizobium tianshanense]
MLSRRLFISACAWFIIKFPSQSYGQEAWTSYRNARFGTSIAYQEFFEPDPPPANGDGQSFTGPEGANFRVYARQNADNETPASHLVELLADSSHANVTYSHIRNDRLTISGVRGNLIYYEAYVFSGRGVLHAFEMEYPAKFKASYDPTVQRMARSFKGP